MKRLALAAFTIILMVGAVTYVTAASASTRGEKGAVIGEVIDIGNYAIKGLLGEDPAEAGRYRSDLGFPIGILEDGTGRVYVALYKLPVPAAGLQTGNTVLSPLMGRKVVAQGTKYHTAGVDVLQISLVAEY